VEKAGPNIVDLLYLAGPFDGSIVVAAISQWRRCLSACVRAHGGHLKTHFMVFSWFTVLS